MLCPWEKLYGRRPTSLVLPFMMPSFRHANRKTKMHSNGERCFYLNTGHDHSCTPHKVLLASGVASYTIDVISGYHRRPFVKESPTWGDGAVVSSPPSPQQPQLMGAGGGAGAVEHQRARPAAAFNGIRGRCRGGGASASAAAAATAAAAFNGSRRRCRGGGASASAAAAATAAAVFSGRRGWGRDEGDTATVAVAAAGAGTVVGDRRSGCGNFSDGPVDNGSRRAHRW